MNAPISRRLAAAMFAASVAAAPAVFADPLAASFETQSGFDHDRTCSGEPCDAVVRGALRFVDRRLRDLDGNGRACADCHMLTDHFQLSPAAADARFKLLEWQRRWNPRADDPLFRPVDADDFRINGENARDFSNLRQNGLVRITLPLPPTIEIHRPSDERAVGGNHGRRLAHGADHRERGTHRPGRHESVATRAQQHGRLPARRARRDPAGASARRVAQPRASRVSAVAAVSRRPHIVPTHACSRARA